MSKVNAIYHIVINTKDRKPAIPMLHRKKLYAYIHAIIQNKGCRTLRINGIENHVHILLDLHPSVALSTLIGEIKRSSTLWLRNQIEFPKFDYWGKEYFAASVSHSDWQSVKEYICNQEEHHKGIAYEDEMKRWAETHDFEWNEHLLS
ncbi:MAG: IS200/IS605 family transposase [Bacteroides sp.]|nr:IS200/IS605 family transposase [Bacteroides sp.]